MEKLVNNITEFDKSLNQSQYDKELILHIGHKKTGSSFIQSVLERNSSLLEKHGYFYPPSCSDNSQNALQGKISSGNGINFFDHKNFQSNLFNFCKLSTHDDKSRRKIILSSELLFDHLVNDKILEKIN